MASVQLPAHVVQVFLAQPNPLLGKRSSAYTQNATGDRATHQRQPTAQHASGNAGDSDNLRAFAGVARAKLGRLDFALVVLAHDGDRAQLDVVVGFVPTLE